MKNIKIGDIVRINSGKSIFSQKNANKIGKILKIGYHFLGKQYVILDIDIKGHGVWLNELELVEKAKTKIKLFGIAEFCKKHYK